MNRRINPDFVAGGWWVASVVPGTSEIRLVAAPDREPEIRSMPRLF
jgi:hypothetical protein